MTVRLPESPGTCSLCGAVSTPRKILSHLATCAPAHDASGRARAIVRRRFRSAGDPRYWLYLEASADALLEDVDYLLRKVWLECCGHMSAFFAGRREELGMGEKVGAVLATPGFRFSHEYDFGSTTILAGRVGGTRKGSLGTDNVRLLARNDFEPESCSKCSAQASVVCSLCLDTGHVDQAYLCGEHSPDHHCSPWKTLLPVVNSPRMGVCGYGG